MAVIVVFIVLLLIAGAYATVFISTKGDEEYRKATKGNIARLSWIYVVVITLSLAAVGVYIVL
ncbi:hypothetical protein [Pseudobacillus wudalianchiensis]|uniref:Uncharacterized protein n=1 Tax=Pseudobacillus wudalianchiensis TaxID=1743143 RepID=A0A1B9AG96_9BACI|nr:hypothetical protein [Bacillus wudalianchiensis]OCA82854.1 hypothetical protein A8F95_14070 [Bacillus wudalianchiensis]